ncbi:MAG: biopolymer transporter ExbD [Planctomycetes bacterium]|nr:biopolymer transporter ExbD [Planctomycetota bacterium]
MPLKTHRDEAPSLNLTPMIDVVFLLIIFFMVGTTFTDAERNLAVHVPEVANPNAGSPPAPTRRTVTIDRAGALVLDREPVTLDELERKLKAAAGTRRGLGVLVRGDADSSLQQVASVLHACRQAGISEMGISVRLARAPNGASTGVR